MHNVSRSFPSTITLVLAAAAACCGVSQTARAADIESDNGSYCSSTGGTPSVMRPWSGTNNNPPQWTAYGGIVQACTYTSADGSDILLWNSTLTSAKPTMAALAYYARQPMQPVSGNPSIYYCEQLKGSWMIGNGADGGGWSATRGGRVYGMCVFSDGSAIDAWGLTYHSANIVRGIDLTTVLKFPNPY